MYKHHEVPRVAPEIGTCRAYLHILNMNLLNNFKICEGEKLTDFNGEINSSIIIKKDFNIPSINN